MLSVPLVCDTVSAIRCLNISATESLGEAEGGLAAALKPFAVVPGDCRPPHRWRMAGVRILENRPAPNPDACLKTAPITYWSFVGAASPSPHTWIQGGCDYSSASQPARLPGRPWGRTHAQALQWFMVINICECLPCGIHEQDRLLGKTDKQKVTVGAH